MNSRPTTNNLQQGFTLIEIMTSLSVFLVIMTISMGSILGVFDSNRKSQALRTVMNNLNLSVESMAREMRYGRNYHCGSATPITSPLNCVNGDNFISFLSSDGSQVVYRLTGTAIEKSTNGGASYMAITAPEIVIDDLDFYVLGAGSQAPKLQPKTIVRIKGHSGAGKSLSNFVLQTMVSQRQQDI